MVEFGVLGEDSKMLFLELEGLWYFYLVFYFICLFGDFTVVWCVCMMGMCIRGG